MIRTLLRMPPPNPRNEKLNAPFLKQHEFQSKHKISLVVNTLSEPHDPKETLKKPIN